MGRSTTKLNIRSPANKLVPNPADDKSFGLTDEEYEFLQDDISLAIAEAGNGAVTTEPGLTKNHSSKVKENKKKNKEDNQFKEKSKYTSYKYSNRSKCILHEAAIIEGHPLLEAPS